MAGVGILMLVHTALGRAEQVARHWHAAGCPVVIHIDRKVPEATCAQFRKALADLPNLRFFARVTAANGAPGALWPPRKAQPR
jgi:hypothetical protein